jgi:hypothetical protein
MILFSSAPIAKARTAAACGGMSNPRSLNVRVHCATHGALAGIRKLKPAAEKFYAALNDEQKVQANLFVDWPGL